MTGGVDQVLALPLRVADVALSARRRDTSSGFERVTTVVELRGDGRVGRGEDVTYEADAHERLAASGLSVPTGEFTLASFSAALDDADLHPGGEEADGGSAARHYRRWGVESAALDLALRQADTTLGGVLDRTPEPVRFVVSTRLPGDPPTADRVHDWLAIDPDLAFKLDPTPEWSDDLLADLADTGAVRVLDLKGHYEDTAVDAPADAAFYERVFEAFPDAVVEDPALTDETRPVVAEHADRVAWDVPFTSPGDLDAFPFEPSVLNLKPSRFGTVERVLRAVAACEDRGVQLYGGGQFELGPGRGHLHDLASLWYPASPNDVAPRGYNDPEPDAGLPGSPLAVPDADRVGFGWPPR